MSIKVQIRDRRGGNRYFIDNALLRGGWGKKEKLGPYGIAIYNALALHADIEDQTAYPSYATLGDLTGMSERQAIRMIAKLESFSIIHKVSNIHNGKQSSNIYELLHPNAWRKVAYDSQSPPAMTHSHPSYDSQSPKQDPSNKTHLNNVTPNGVSATQKSTTKKRKAETAPIKEKDKPKRPPAVDIYRSVANRFPDKATWPLLERVTDLEFWEKVVRHWIACGWNKLNVKGMLECYDRRELPTAKKNGASNGKTHQRNNTQSFEASRDAAQERLDRHRNAA